MGFLSLIFLIFTTTPASAELRLQSQPLGASAVLNFIPNGPQTSLQVIGGLVGDDSMYGCTSKTGSSTCDNCCPDAATCGATWKACNKNRIYPSLRLQFTFLSTDKAGIPSITTPNGTSETLVAAGNSATLQPNVTVSLYALWSEICDAFTNTTAANCEFTGEQTFKVGIDGNSDGDLLDSEDDAENFKIRVVYRDPTDPAPFDVVFSTANGNTALCSASGGICNFSLLKGDEKATIKNLQVGTTGSSVVFYCVAEDDPLNDDYSLITQADVCAGPVQINGANSLSNDTIEGMENGVTYLYRAGIIDIAGNIGLFYHGDSALCPAGTTDCHKVTPEEVVGMFTEEMNCFIATTAYGSPMAKSVKTLRRFRDQVLKKTAVGQLLIDTYYTVSPTMARWVAKSPERRSAARAALFPVVTLVTFVMDEPLWVCIGLMSLLFVLVWRVRSRKATT